MTLVVFKEKVEALAEGMLEVEEAVEELTERVNVSVSRYHCTTREAIEAPKMAAARTMLAQFLDL
jgi:ribonuclease BN (tRNA processing enzyme)